MKPDFVKVKENKYINRNFIASLEKYEASSSSYDKKEHSVIIRPSFNIIIGMFLDKEEKENEIIFHRLRYTDDIERDTVLKELLKELL